MAGTQIAARLVDNTVDAPGNLPGMGNLFNWCAPRLVAQTCKAATRCAWWTAPPTRRDMCLHMPHTWPTNWLQLCSFANTSC